MSSDRFVPPPNLFSYATSELSQDAFIAWLLRWSDGEFADANPALHRAGRNLVFALLGDQETSVRDYSRCVVKRQAPAKVDGQRGAIDVLAELSNSPEDPPHLLVIESKIGAGRHSKQLERYKACATEKKNAGDACDKTLIYLKIRDESYRDGSPVPGYRVFDRSDFIRVLERAKEEGCENDIVDAYLGYLKRIEKKVMWYAEEPTEKWLPKPEDPGSTDRLPWEGLFSRLQRELEAAGKAPRWGYVSNARGGFMALWWNGHHIEGVDGGRIYLQLEYDKLTFRILVPDSEAQRSLRQEWHRRILEAARESELQVGKPTRYQSGRTMCVAVADRYVETDEVGRLDLEKTIATLREAEHIVSRAVALPQ